MKSERLAIPLVQAALIVLAIVMCAWGSVPWLSMVGIGLFGLNAIGARASATGRFQQRGIPIAAVSSLLVLAGWILFHRSFWSTYLDFYYATIIWLLAGALLPLGWNITRPKASQWRAVILVLAWAGCFLWLATAYVHNTRAPFYAGLGFTAALLILWKLWFQLSTIAIQALNTLLLIVIGLPLADLFLHPGYALPPKPDALQHYRKYYCYKAAKNDRAAFEVWWNYFYFDQYKTLEKQLITRDPGPLRFRFRPNSHGTLVRSQISINSLGFRGKEIRPEKGNTYRIVTLGESTTFGFTIDPDDKPWPEILETLIRERLHPDRPVEVINAGIPGADPVYSLRRLQSEILPLKPDMLICYHGINGFHLLDRGQPALQGRPPLYLPRPLQLLADCEYRIRLLHYGRNLAAQLLNQPSRSPDVMQTDCAKAYRGLIQAAQTNHIRFVLANFSMAVNDRSPADVVEFFRPRFPSVCLVLRNNDAHSQLVEQLARDYADICFVNTHPHLDGEEEKYLDLVHFCHAGDQQLAENFFAGIEKVLEQDLTHSSTTASNH